MFPACSHETKKKFCLSMDETFRASRLSDTVLHREILESLLYFSGTVEYFCVKTCQVVCVTTPQRYVIILGCQKCWDANIFFKDLFILIHFLSVWM